jgi:hypothetical protein
MCRATPSSHPMVVHRFRGQSFQHFCSAIPARSDPPALGSRATISTSRSKVGLVPCVDGSSTGIAMCHIAVFEELLKRSHPWISSESLAINEETGDSMDGEAGRRQS